MKHAILIAALLLVTPLSAFAQIAPPAATKDYSRLVDNSGPDIGMALTRNGNISDNRLGGTPLGDVFRGAKGADTLTGYDGNDRYVFDAGDGGDTIYDHSVEGNRIVFRASVDPASVIDAEVPGYNGEIDRLIRYGEGDAIRIVGWSRLSSETKAGWSIEHSPPPKVRVDSTPHPEMPSLTDALIGYALKCILVFGGLFLLGRYLRNKGFLNK